MSLQRVKRSYRTSIRQTLDNGVAHGFLGKKNTRYFLPKTEAGKRKSKKKVSFDSLGIKKRTDKAAKKTPTPKDKENHKTAEVMVQSGEKSASPTIDKNVSSKESPENTVQTQVSMPSCSGMLSSNNHRQPPENKINPNIQLYM